MKTTKNIIMGIAAVMAASSLSISSISAQENVPQQAGEIGTAKASEAVTIEIGNESDKYTVIGSGSESVSIDNIVTLAKEKDNKDNTETVLQKDGEIGEADVSEAITVEIGNASIKNTVISAGSENIAAGEAAAILEKDAATK